MVMVSQGDRRLLVFDNKGRRRYGLSQNPSMGYYSLSGDSEKG